MLAPLTSKEATNILLREVDTCLEDDMCFSCAVKVAGKRYGLTWERVEEVYLAEKGGKNGSN